MRKMKNPLVLFLLVVSITTVSCTEENLVKTTGRIVYISLEGGFYGILGDDGVKYDPVNLSSDFQQDSLGVRFEGKILTDQTSIHMWGKLLQLSRIDRLQ